MDPPIPRRFLNVKKDKEITRVIFVMEKIRGVNDGVLAIMPDNAGTNDPDTCTCYRHVGQHGSMQVAYRRRCRAARPKEYDELKWELEMLGYNIEVITRIPQNSRKNRLAQINGTK